MGVKPRTYPVPEGHRGGCLGATATLDRIDLAAAQGNEWAAKVLAKENQRTLGPMLDGDPRLPKGVLDGDDIIGLWRDDHRYTGHRWESCPFPTGAELVDLDSDSVAFVARAQVEGMSARLLPYTPVAVIGAIWDPVKHPRARNGQFIEVGGRLLIVQGPWKNRRGEVTAITPDPQYPKLPNLSVRLADTGEEVTVKPDEVDADPSKATLGKLVRRASDWLTITNRANPDTEGLLVSNLRGIDPTTEEARRLPPGIDLSRPRTVEVEEEVEEVDWDEAEELWRRRRRRLPMVAAAELPVGTKVIAVVDDMDRDAVLDAVAVLPGPKILRRHDGDWMDDPAWITVLRSVRPPPVVILTDDQITDVLGQIDEHTAGQEFVPTKITQQGTRASAFLARADEMVIEWALATPVIAAAVPGRMPPELQRYWRYGAGAAKIRWGTKGAMTRCARYLAKYVGPGRAYQTCNNLSKPLGGKGVAWDVG